MPSPTGPRPPAFFLVALLAQAGLHLAIPVATPIPLSLSFLGVPCVLVGLLMVIWPARTFDRARTAIDPFGTPSLLMTDGWYRITRNPMYLGMALVLLGAALLLRTVTPFLIVPAFVWLIDRRFIRYEEATLASLFGEAYSAYRGRVRRWV